MRTSITEKERRSVPSGGKFIRPDSMGVWPDEKDFADLSALLSSILTAQRNSSVPFSLDIIMERLEKTVRMLLSGRGDSYIDDSDSIRSALLRSFFSLDRKRSNEEIEALYLDDAISLHRLCLYLSYAFSSTPKTPLGQWTARETGRRTSMMVAPVIGEMNLLLSRKSPGEDEMNALDSLDADMDSIVLFYMEADGRKTISLAHRLLSMDERQSKTVLLLWDETKKNVDDIGWRRGDLELISDIIAVSEQSMEGVSIDSNNENILESLFETDMTPWNQLCAMRSFISSVSDQRQRAVMMEASSNIFRVLGGISFARTQWAQWRIRPFADMFNNALDYPDEFMAEQLKLHLESIN